MKKLIAVLMSLCLMLGAVVVFTFSAANPEAYRDLFQLMAASIQRAD